MKNQFTSGFNAGDKAGKTALAAVGFALTNIGFGVGYVAGIPVGFARGLIPASVKKGFSKSADEPSVPSPDVAVPAV